QRRIAVGAASVAAVVALIVGVTANVLPRLNAAPLPPGTTVTPTTTPTGEPTATTSPTASASPAATLAGPDADPEADIPDLPPAPPQCNGVLTGRQGATPGPCASGRQTFGGGVANPGRNGIQIVDLADGSLDGQPVTVSALVCNWTGELQLASYHGTAGAYTLI